jgi:hypothetical protein
MVILENSLKPLSDGRDQIVAFLAGRSAKLHPGRNDDAITASVPLFPEPNQ